MAAVMNDDRKAKDAVVEAREFYQERSQAQEETRNRADFAGDLRFVYVPGAQWDEEARNKRQGRPCYSYNRTAGAVNQLVGDQRMATVSGKVRPASRSTTLKLADTISGLIRDIEAKSFAQTVYAEGFKYAVAGAWGVWRVVPEYMPDSWDQVLRIRRVRNPLSTYFDGAADPFGRGAMQVLVAERMSRTRFKALYPNATVTNFDVNNDSQGWYDQNEVRVAEYYKLEAKDHELALLSDGRTVPYTEGLRENIALAKNQGLKTAEIVKTRVDKKFVCKWWKIDGVDVLEGPYEYDYYHIPVIRVPGRHVNIEGEDHFQSLIRHAHDAARTYNYDRSSMVETVALQPRAPYLVTARMIEGYEDEWKRSNQSNSPILRYNIDEDAVSAGVAGGGPKRERGPEVPQAFIALAAHDAEDIRQTIGYTNPAVEQQTRAGDAESGRALRTRLTAGDSGSYEFLDNLQKAIQYTWDVITCMLPVHYDSARTERVLSADGRTEDFVELNPQELKRAKVDTVVTLGPAYATARLEALDTLLEAGERMPIIHEEAPDIIVANLDVQGGDEIERRVRMRLIREGRIKPTREEAEAMGPPPPPDPMQTALKNRVDAQTKKDLATAARTTVETAQEMAEAENAKKRDALELAQMVADLILTRTETLKVRREANEPRKPNGA